LGERTGVSGVDGEGSGEVLGDVEYVYGKFI